MWNSTDGIEEMEWGCPYKLPIKGKSISLLVAPSYSNCLLWTYLLPTLGASSALIVTRSGASFLDHIVALPLSLTYLGGRSLLGLIFFLSLLSSWLQPVCLLACSFPSPCCPLLVCVRLSFLLSFLLLLSGLWWRWLRYASMGTLSFGSVERGYGERIISR